MAGNTALGRAKDAKQDEFYTQLTDIENELRHYRRHFRGKTVLCNCDDPYESNFFRYFALNFNRLKLKKLLATSYSGSPITGTQLSPFGDETEEERRMPYKAVVTTVHDTTGEGGVDMLDVAELFRTGENTIERLKGDGDFRSTECLELLDEADIVVTNPPFSLFREYIAVLMERKKKFIAIGNENALKYKEVFPFIQQNEIWIGVTFPKEFIVPKVITERKNTHTRPDGTIVAKFGNVCWYTNLDIKKRHEEMVLFKRYKPDEYPRYVNYDAIEVSKVANIPCDYAGEMGVPITFLNAYNPDQFELVGVSNVLGVRNEACKAFDPKGGKCFYLGDGRHVTKRIYDRLVIRNRHPEEPRQ